MQYVITIISLMVQAFFFWHASTKMSCCADRWVLYVLMIPVVGPALYFFLVYLPMELQAKQKIGLQQMAINLIDPKRALREASRAYEATPTPDNAHRLAQVLLRNGDGAGAEGLLQGVLTQIGERDPRVLIDLADAQRLQGKLSPALSLIDEALAQANLGSKQAELMLARGRVLEEMGRISPASESYRAAAERMGGEEARCRLAGTLIKLGQNNEAERILAEVQKRLDVAPIHYRSQQAAWIKECKALRKNCGTAA